MAQTSIAVNPTVAVAGTFATGIGTPLNTRSLEAADTIAVGKFVVVTVDDATTCEVPDAIAEAGSGRGLGIAMRPASGATSYSAGETVTIAYTGEIWTVGEDTGVIAGAIAWVRGANAGTYGLGSFRSDLDTNGAVELPNAVFTSNAASAGDLVRVWLNGPFI
jgi:hypothetical protein